MNNLFFPDKSKSGLEQAKITAIDRAKGRISIALRTGLVTTAAYLYDISDLRVGLNVVVGRVSGGYVIMNQVVVSDKVKLSYGRGGIVSPINIPPVTDILGPSLIITSHVNNQIVGTSAITISGTASDSGYGNHGISQVTINGVRADNDTALGKNMASWSKTITLTLASTVITIIAYDNFSAPNTTTKVITIITTADVEVLAYWNDSFDGSTIDTEKWFLSSPPPLISSGAIAVPSISGSYGASCLGILGDNFSVSLKIDSLNWGLTQWANVYLLVNPYPYVDGVSQALFSYDAYEPTLQALTRYPNGDWSYENAVLAKAPTWLNIVRNGSLFTFNWAYNSDISRSGNPLFTATLWGGPTAVSISLSGYGGGMGPTSIRLDDFVFISGAPAETPKAEGAHLYWGQDLG